MPVVVTQGTRDKDQGGRVPCPILSHSVLMMCWDDNGVRAVCVSSRQRAFPGVGGCRMEGGLRKGGWGE